MTSCPFRRPCGVARGATSCRWSRCAPSTSALTATPKRSPATSTPAAPSPPARARRRPQIAGRTINQELPGARTARPWDDVPIRQARRRHRPRPCHLGSEIEDARGPSRAHRDRRADGGDCHDGSQVVVGNAHHPVISAARPPTHHHDLGSWASRAVGRSGRCAPSLFMGDEALHALPFRTKPCVRANPHSPEGPDRGHVRNASPSDAAFAVT